MGHCMLPLFPGKLKTPNLSPEFVSDSVPRKRAAKASYPDSCFPRARKTAATRTSGRLRESGEVATCGIFRPRQRGGSIAGIILGITRRLMSKRPPLLAQLLLRRCCLLFFLQLSSFVLGLPEMKGPRPSQRKRGQVLGHLRTLADVQQVRRYLYVATWVGVENVSLNGSHKSIKNSPRIFARVWRVNLPQVHRDKVAVRDGRAVAAVAVSPFVRAVDFLQRTCRACWPMMSYHACH